ncbi:MAG: hypothetical protein KME41_14665 [Candidatus Thiodiazotropha sp. (ex Lucina pensylvanica)]|nr:hypothetical protein [Candidatus Thiodiazotropha sp. (ex Lucina pensylvanica)]MBT3041000.1 hypothetical protein [Candidatus Thiodiazotropha sp. (ex Codakia orbicularis)]
MKLRAYLLKRKIIFDSLAFVWIGFAIAYFFIIDEYQGLYSFSTIVSVALFCGLLIFAWHWIKCPKCKNSLFQFVMMENYMPIAISKKLKYCPYCSKGLDEEI